MTAEPNNKERPSSTHTEDHRFDALLPPEMALSAERAGVRKSSLDPLSVTVLALLGGAFIGFGAMFATTVGAGAAEALPFGLTRLLSGLTFSLGLILIIVGGAELFTGNALIVVAWSARRVSTGAMLRNWAIVYAGNLVGSCATAAIIFAGGQYRLGGGDVGVVALSIAASKTSLDFGQALALGIVANTLVCLAVWMCFSARTVVGKVVAIVPPIAAFVAGGFEHSIANMYFLAMGLLIKHFASDGFWAESGTSAADYASVTLADSVMNLIPVTIGNIIGGGVLVAAVYWFVYLRRR